MLSHPLYYVFPGHLHNRVEMGLPSASTRGFPLLIRSLIIALKSSLALATSVITSRF